MEFNYMILQAYDFLELNKSKNCLMQIGGSDQWGNIVNGVELIKRHSGNQVYGLTTPLITLASGAKMGKTEQGAVWLDKKILSPYDYWQFWRNTDDRDVIKFLKMFTNIPLNEIEKIKENNINDLKIILANKATAMLHGEKESNNAEKIAKNAFQKATDSKKLPSLNLESEFFSSLDIAGIIAFLKLTSSKSEARRLIKNKGIKVNDKLVEDDKIIIDKKLLNENNFFKLSLGKKKHFKIIIN
tara:strand:- start:541 stop:1269 length:729 start_codon:yes stop_codon:yes gene_type:complete